MFKKILIANRGEIACRIVRSARKMGITTVAVYSHADRDSLHVMRADEAIEIGPSMAIESYLVVDKIIDACKKTGAQAVHPGYGFLSENASFAGKLEQNGIVFIGPREKAIEIMGDKITSKKVAEQAGVNIIPGVNDVIRDSDHAVEIASAIGYPVMLKASAGGGGKGMRTAWDDDQCRNGFERASSEAAASFGDDHLFIEKFLEQPRHIEIQLIADNYGNVVTLNERECSIQRRHQKIIEEAPSVFIDPTIRKQMSDQATMLARAVDYTSVGTVEFIVDKNKQFYFLEMNTRLQVEHPVTEYITGLDLVDMMIRVAAGEVLEIKQSDIGINGWAIEARVYAESPRRNFLPSSGRLRRYCPPTEGEQVRLDTGVYEGAKISTYYDPMVSKLITWGKCRQSAITKMRWALDQYYIRGIDTNLPFLSAIMALPRFNEGDLSTDFIEQEYPDGFNSIQLQTEQYLKFVVVAAMAHNCYSKSEASLAGVLPGSAHLDSIEWVVLIDDQQYLAQVKMQDSIHQIFIGDRVYQVSGEWALGQPVFNGMIDGERVCMQIDKDAYKYQLFHQGAQVNIKVLSPTAARFEQLMPVKTDPDLSRFLLSPMPGLLTTVLVEAEQSVEQGAKLVVIEAMKMENVIAAGQDCIIAKVLCSNGDTLEVGDPIIEFKQAKIVPGD